MDHSEQLKPGPEVLAASPGRARGTGQADGVVYLDTLYKPLAEGGAVIAEKSAEPQALRYIKCQSLDWHTHPRNEGRRGYRFISNYALLLTGSNAEVAKQIYAKRDETGQPIVCMLLDVKGTENALMPEHRQYWKLVTIPGEDKVWALFYEKPAGS